MNQQEFIQKVFSMCHHQVQTKNPYTGELIMVPCGTCPACRYNKSILSQNKVHAQSLVSRHVYFITLTYAQRYIPYYVMKTTPQKQGRGYLLPRMIWKATSLSYGQCAKVFQRKLP